MHDSSITCARSFPSPVAVERSHSKIRADEDIELKVL